MTQPRCRVCQVFLNSEYVDPDLCDIHLEEAWMVFMTGDDSEREVV